MRKCMWAGQLALMLLALSLAALAQSIISGEVSGTVTDQTGAVVRNVNVTLNNTETGAKQTAVTNDSGTFRFPLLHPGNYQVTAEVQGFQSVSRRVTVGVGQVTNASMQLSPGSVSQTIEVSGAAPILQTENANLATTFNPSQIQNLPNPGGDLTNYALSSPGVVLSTGAGYGNFTAYGMPGTSNLYTVNGGDMNDPYNNLNNSGSSNNMLGQNEIQEVAIVHNGYTGQYGRGASMNMNFTTKSGTNSFHGNAEWLWNGRYLNANDWFNNNTETPRPFANSNQWGGSFGGPIVKNKLFFFYDNEGLRYVLPGGSSPVYVPTTAWANAVTANIAASQPAELPFYQKMFSLYAAAPGASAANPVNPADPTKQGGCGDFAGSVLGGTLFGGPGGQACTKTFRSLVNNLNKERLQAIRVDWNASSRDTMSFRYWQDRGTQPTYTDPINSAFNALSVQPQDAGQFTLNHQITPNVVNQLILGGFYYSAIFGPASIAKATSVFPTSIGVAQGPNNCALLDGNLSCMGGEVYRYPQGRNVTQYQLVDDLSWTRGRHALKFGANFRRVDFADYSPAANHTGNLRMSSITDFVNGVLSSNGSQLRQQFAQANDYQINNYSLGFYGQDEWRVGENLKLTLALRIDRNSNETCVRNCFSRFAGDFSTINHNVSTPYNQSVLAGQSTLFNSLEPVVWQPRAGFSWSPRTSTVVRGGGGLFSDLYPAQLSSNLISNPPNLALWTISATGSQTIPIAPGVPNSAFTQAANNNAAFVNGFFNGGTLASIKAAVPRFTGPNFYTTSRHMLNPKYAEWNLEVQQGFGSRTVASVNYVGNHGMDLLILANGVNAFSKSSHFVALPTAAPDARFGVVTQLSNGAISNYNGVTTSLTRRMSGGFSGTLSYTYSRSLDTISNAGIDPYSTNQVGDSLRFQVDPRNSRLNYGPSDYDFRHVLSLNYVWELPLARNNRFLGGWTIAGLLYRRSGQPYSVVNTSIPGRLGNYNTANAVVIADFLGGPTPNCTVNSSTSLTDNQQTNPFACLTTAQFDTASAQPGFGNIRRNFFRGPGYFNTDFSVRKNFRVTERLALELGANAYNVLNHPNFGNPDSSLTSGTFGTIQNTVTPASSPYGNFQGSAVSGRVLQLQLGVSF